MNQIFSKMRLQTVINMASTACNLNVIQGLYREQDMTNARQCRHQSLSSLSSLQVLDESFLAARTIFLSALHRGSGCVITNSQIAV